MDKIEKPIRAATQPISDLSNRVIAAEKLALDANGIDPVACAIYALAAMIGNSACVIADELHRIRKAVQR